MTAQKDGKLNRAKCLSVSLFVKFNVIELLTQQISNDLKIFSCFNCFYAFLAIVSVKVTKSLLAEDTISIPNLSRC